MRGICVPILMQILIGGYCLKGCMLILGSIIGHICPCALLLRPAHKYPLIQKEEQVLPLDGNLDRNQKNYNSSHDMSEQGLPKDELSKANSAECRCMKADHEVKVKLIKNSKCKSRSPLTSRHHIATESGILGANITAISSISLSSQINPEEFLLMEDISHSSPKEEKNEFVKCCEFFQTLNFSLFKNVTFSLLMLCFSYWRTVIILYSLFFRLMGVKKALRPIRACF